jgi:hypothetical protein
MPISGSSYDTTLPKNAVITADKTSVNRTDGMAGAFGSSTGLVHDSVDADELYEFVAAEEMGASAKAT